MRSESPKMSDPDDDLKPNQLRAIAALAGGSTIAEAAKAASVTERQLLRWRGQPAFAHALRDATSATFDDALRVLAAGMRGAATYLVKAAVYEDEPLPAQTAAARSVLQLASAMREHVDLASRLDALEAAQADDNRPR